MSSLLLNGSKTITIAGTEMQCIEIYTGESYTFPIAFTNAAGDPVDCTGWTLGIAAKFYLSDTVTYSAISATTVTLGNLSLTAPQPSTGGGTYSANLAAAFTTIGSGLGYIFVPSDITGGTGSPNPTPELTLANSTTNTNLIILTLTVTRTDVLSSLVDISREPIGMIVRYQ